MFPPNIGPWVKAHWIWLIVLVLAVGLALLVARWLLAPEPPPAIRPIEIKPDTVVLHDRPTPKPPGIGTRIISHPVPITRVVTEGTPDTARVYAFARKVFEAESLRAVVARLRQERGNAAADSAAAETPAPLLPGVSGKYDGRRFDLWLARSDGRVMQATAKLRPRWSFVVGAGGLTDSVPAFREDRWWVRQAREVPGCLPGTALGAGAGAASDGDHRLRNGVIGAAVGLLICLSD